MTMVSSPKMARCCASWARQSTLLIPSRRTPRANCQPWLMAMADRTPAYEPGPSPTAIKLISAGRLELSFKARSIKTRPVDPRKFESAALAHRVNSPAGPISATATERALEENSNARIFIADDAFGLTLD